MPDPVLPDRLPREERVRQDDTLYRREVGPEGTERYVPVTTGRKPRKRCATCGHSTDHMAGGGCITKGCGCRRWVQEPGERVCERCRGTGRAWHEPEPPRHMETCPDCGGTGRVHA